MKPGHLFSPWNSRIFKYSSKLSLGRSDNSTGGPDQRRLQAEGRGLHPSVTGCLDSISFDSLPRRRPRRCSGRPCWCRCCSSSGPGGSWGEVGTWYTLVWLQSSRKTWGASESPAGDITRRNGKTNFFAVTKKTLPALRKGSPGLGSERSLQPECSHSVRGQAAAAVFQKGSGFLSFPDSIV